MYSVWFHGHNKRPYPWLFTSFAQSSYSTWKIVLQQPVERPITMVRLFTDEVCLPFYLFNTCVTDYTRSSTWSVSGFNFSMRYKHADLPFLSRILHCESVCFSYVAFMRENILNTVWIWWSFFLFNFYFITTTVVTAWNVIFWRLEQVFWIHWWVFVRRTFLNKYFFYW